MGYKLLGWIVWNGGRWVVRRKLRGALPRRGVMVAAGVAAGGAAAALAAGAAGGRRAGR